MSPTRPGWQPLRQVLTLGRIRLPGPSRQQCCPIDHSETTRVPGALVGQMIGAELRFPVIADAAFGRGIADGDLGRLTALDKALGKGAQAVRIRQIKLTRIDICRPGKRLTGGVGKAAQACNANVTRSIARSALRHWLGARCRGEVRCPIQPELPTVLPLA